MSPFLDDDRRENAAARTDAGIRISIDRGGTFCDVIAEIPGREEIIFKLLSVDPQHYADAPTEAIRRVLERVEGRAIPRSEKLDGSRIASCRIGTTIATNALLEHKGEKFAFATTEGFRDVCIVGDQTRPKLFDLKVVKPKALHDTVIEIDERVTIEDHDLNPWPRPEEGLLHDPDVVKTPSGELIRILRKPDETSVRQQLTALREQGYTSLAICLTHAWAFPDHEQIVASIAREVSFTHVTTSHETYPAIKLLDRATAVCSEAYLYPIVRDYVSQFERGFERLPQRVDFMSSDGGLRQAQKFKGNEALLSGPAGGVVGVAQSCYDPADGVPLIGFDMGGTSTDVCRYDGKYDFLTETKIADRSIVAQILNISTVAAGGGSILSLRNGLLAVGPESAGAFPGPACYRNGGPLTVTDANLFLGRLVLSSFPAIFGKNGNEPLDPDIVQEKFAALTAEYNLQTGSSLSPEELAFGFLDVANEAMSRPIRNTTEARGYDPAKHRLVSFGGAGGQHACAIADKLGIGTVLIHKHSSLLSAYGISQAQLQHEARAPFSGTWSTQALPQVRDQAESLQKAVRAELESQGAELKSAKFETSVNLRYFGTDTSLTISTPKDDDYGRAFTAKHAREFAFTMERKIVIDSISVRGVASSGVVKKHIPPTAELERVQKSPTQSRPSAVQSAYVQGSRQNIPVFILSEVPKGTAVTGPALLIDATQTILVESSFIVYILSKLIVMEKSDAQLVKKEAKVLGAIQLSVFAHRFISIAEQMGNTLQRTSISSSIRERLDFSCAIFSPEGKLIANAPHIPIHLGSMQFAIQAQHRHWEGRLQEGDVLLTNHPEWGGTHLPDLTVVTPCFIDGTIAFYVASRGHHTDIGGKGITSMMPESKMLWEEGISVESMKIASGGQFLEDAVRESFHKAGEHPGCAPTRRLQDNVSDLKAQMSANQRGITLLKKLCYEVGLQAVHQAMEGIQGNAESAVRAFLRDLAKTHPEPLTAVDYYDDGTPINLRITIDPSTGSAEFDFEGTGPQIWGNFNSPISITHSAVIYTIRCLLNLEIPLNEGCLTPISIKVPKNSILNPGPGVAICGSTIASQRVVDTILKAFGVVAAFQGCASSFGWGTGGRDPATGAITPGWNFGEAIGGGCGAGPGWHGEHATQVHSTNTRMTDPEVVEKRTQVLVRRSVIREGSGGQGRWCGGNGVTREIEARMPLKFSILSDRRVFAPYGMDGGEDGKPGKNLVFKKDGTGEGLVEVNLGGKAVVELEPGEYIQINTPGGGGWGRPE
jgi:5-oxoprolinase (ATP-hydrolysing)